MDLARSPNAVSTNQQPVEHVPFGMLMSWKPAGLHARSVS